MLCTHKECAGPHGKQPSLRPAGPHPHLRPAESQTSYLGCSMAQTMP